MRFFQSIGIILLSISLIVGCSSKPSETEARQPIEQKIQKNSKGLIKLISFKKTNAIASEINGVKLYEMEWIANIELTCDCYWLPEQFQAYTDTDVPLLSMVVFKKGQKGERFNVAGKTLFEKTENGWRISNGL